jgi:hypothetical protein
LSLVDRDARGENKINVFQSDLVPYMPMKYIMALRKLVLFKEDGKLE